MKKRRDLYHEVLEEIREDAKMLRDEGHKEVECRAYERHAALTLAIYDGLSRLIGLSLIGFGLLLLLVAKLAF